MLDGFVNNISQIVSSRDVPVVTLADIAIYPMTRSFGWLFGFMIFIPVVLIEGYLLKRMGWADLRASLKDVAIANAVSTLAGVIIVEGFSTFGFQCGTHRADGSVGLAVMRCGWDNLVFPYIAIVLMFVLSVLIEGLVLRRRRNNPHLWRMTVVANLVTYLLLLPLLIITLLAFL
jgi:hypothetical protein